MSNPDQSIQDLIGQIESGDAASRSVLQARVDTMLARLATSAPHPGALRAMEVAEAAIPSLEEPFLFSSPTFNAALLKSISRNPGSATPPSSDKGLALRAQAAPSGASEPIRQIFSRMLAANPDSHLSVICHLAERPTSDAIHDLVTTSTERGEFNQDFYGEWLAGVGEILGAEGCLPEPNTDGWIGDVCSTISEGARKVLQSIVACVPDIDDLIRLASSAQELAKMLVDKVVDKAADVASLLSNAFSRGADFVRSLLMGLVHAGTDIGRLFKYFLGLASEKFGAFIDALASISSDLARQVVEWFTNAAGEVLDLAKSAYDAMTKAGKSFIEFLAPLVENPVLAELVKGIIRFAQLLKGVLEDAARFLVDLMVKAFSAHVHLFRGFAQGLEETAMGGKAAIGPGDVAGVAAIAVAVLGIFFATSFPLFTLSVLLLIFAPMLVGVVVGIFASKAEQPSEKFDLGQLPSSRVAIGDPSRKYVVFSDMHRGTKLDAKLGISYTGWNADLYADVLDAYHEADFILVENGDAEDFWNDSTAIMGIAKGDPAGQTKPENRKDLVLDGIRTFHSKTYEALTKFVGEDRFVKVLGNHDMDLDGMEYSLGGRKMNLWDALRIPVRDGAPPSSASATSAVASPLFTSKVANQADLAPVETYVLHGHQVDDANSQESSTLGRAITCLSVLGNMLAKSASDIGELFGDLGAQEVRDRIESAVQSYMVFAGPLEQHVWANQMNTKNYVVKPGEDPSSNAAAKSKYEVPEPPQSAMEAIGLSCLSENPMVRLAIAKNCNIVMGHTHNTKVFPIQNHPAKGILANSGTGGMIENVVSCLEIIGNQVRVVYHVAVGADQGTKDAVGALSL